MAKKHPGRPPKPAEERLSEALYVRLTRAEREAIDRKAREDGTTASDIVRRLIRAAGFGRKKS